MSTARSTARSRPPPTSRSTARPNTGPFPTTRGDCEDYALLKRKRLIARGWPESSLLMTVVRDEKGEGHAVLTARTLQGDFILDNKVDEVKVWHRTRYDYVMRQSYLNVQIWMSLDPAEGSNSTAPLVSVRSR